MLSTSLSPYLDAELAYRLERLSDARPHVAVQRNHRWLQTVRARRGSTAAHRPAPTH